MRTPPRSSSTTSTTSTTSTRKSQPGGELFAAIVAAPFGAIGIRCAAAARGEFVLQELVYLPPRFDEKDAGDPLSAQVARQLDAYFRDPDFVFSVPLGTVGSPFQQRVWQAIGAIPRGQVRTYGQVARLIGSAPRAVGQACGANRFPLLVPCHRVTAAGGLGGFAHDDDESGFHLGVKRWLLAHEHVAGY